MDISVINILKTIGEALDEDLIGEDEFVEAVYKQCPQIKEHCEELTESKKNIYLYAFIKAFNKVDTFEEALEIANTYCSTDLTDCDNKLKDFTTICREKMIVAIGAYCNMKDENTSILVSLSGNAKMVANLIKCILECYPEIKEEFDLLED